MLTNPRNAHPGPRSRHDPGQRHKSAGTVFKGDRRVDPGSLQKHHATGVCLAPVCCRQVHPRDHRRRLWARQPDADGMCAAQPARVRPDLDLLGTWPARPALCPSFGPPSRLWQGRRRRWSQRFYVCWPPSTTSSSRRSARWTTGPTWQAALAAPSRPATALASAKRRPRRCSPSPLTWRAITTVPRPTRHAAAIDRAGTGRPELTFADHPLRPPPPLSMCRTRARTEAW